MLGQLQVVAGPDKGKSVALGHGDKYPIGRGVNARLRLEDPKVSRIHCQVSIEPGKARVFDTGSKAGTWVNGLPVTEQDLHPGDVIRIGDTEIHFTWTDSDLKATDEFIAPRGV